MEEKNQKVKLKGRFQSYLIWPLIMLILFAVMDGFIFMFSIKAGFVALAASLVYAVCMFALYYTVRREVALELVNFALDYGQVQKTLLEELKVPYGVLDEHGRFLWVNHQLKELTVTSPIMKSVDHFSLMLNMTNIFSEQSLRVLLWMIFPQKISLWISEASIIPL